MWRTSLAIAALGFIHGACPSSASAQQITNSAGSGQSQIGFSESVQSAWDVRGPHFFMQFGPPTSANALPGAPFMPPPAIGGLSGTTAFTSGPWSGHLTFSAIQASNAGIGFQHPFVTAMNGQTGYVVDAVQNPFVVSQIPVVGFAAARITTSNGLEGEAAPLPVQPLVHSATSSVAEAKRLRAAEEQRRTDATAHYIAQGDEAAAARKPSVARIFYNMALRRAAVSARPAIEEKLRALDGNSLGAVK